MTGRRLLYLAFWYPPSRASGVYRAIATSRAFVEAGWDVTVITTTEEFLEAEIGSTDKSLLQSVPPEVNIVRVPFSFRDEKELREMGWVQGNFPIVHQKWSTRVSATKSAVKARLGTGAPAVGDNYVSWIEPAVEAALGIHGSFDRILATGNPYSAFEAARRISDRTGTPFSIDYRDPWTIDVFTGERASLPPGSEAAEARIIEAAASCIHVNDPIAEAYRGKYANSPTKHYVVLNGFDPESVSVIPGQYSGDGLSFGILGTVNDRWPLEPIFSAWSREYPNLPTGSRLVLAGHLGYFAKSSDSLGHQIPEIAGFEFVGAVAKSDVASFYGSLDVVIVPVPGSRMVTSGKIFEAMGLGLPFICVQSPDGDARTISSTHPFAVPADPEPASVGAALHRAAELRAGQTENDILETRRLMLPYVRSTTMRSIVTVLDQGTDGKA